MKLEKKTTKIVETNYQITLTREELILLGTILGNICGNDKNPIRQFSDPLYYDIADMLDDKDVEMFNGEKLIKTDMKVK